MVSGSNLNLFFFTDNISRVVGNGGRSLKKHLPAFNDFRLFGIFRSC